MPDSVIGEIASAIHARHIQTPLTVARIFTRASRAADVVDHMERHKYDVTPVFPDGAGERTGRYIGDPDGTLWRVDLSRASGSDEIESAVRPLSGSTLIDGNASLVQVLDRFREGHRFLLVVGGGGIEGIVTPFDMNKQAGRTHLFMQVSALEMAVADRLRGANLQDDEILSRLPKDRASQARSRFAMKQATDEAADLIAALDFHDLLRVERSRSRALSELTDEQLDRMKAFRNSVMHSVLEPAGDDGHRLEVLLAQTSLIAGLLGQLDESA